MVLLYCRHASLFGLVHLPVGYGFCCFIMQVDNLKKETALHWFKDDVEITPEGPANLASGACKLPISLVILSHKHTD